MWFQSKKKNTLRVLSKPQQPTFKTPYSRDSKTRTKDKFRVLICQTHMSQPSDLLLNQLQEPSFVGVISSDKRVEDSLSVRYEEVSRLRANDKRFEKSRYFTADPICIQLDKGNPDKMDAWHQLDDGISIQGFVEVFKENLVKDGDESKRAQKPLLIKYSDVIDQ